MTEVSALQAIFNGSLHVPSRGAALVSGAPGHPPELSSCCSCRVVGPSVGAQPPLSPTASPINWAPSFFEISTS